MMLQRYMEGVKQHHDILALGMRWGCMVDDKPSQRQGSCFAGVEHIVTGQNGTPSDYVWTVFQGDGVELTFEELTDPEKFLAKQRAYERPWNKFEGTERTKKWVSFLMGDTSPWKGMHDCIANKDIDFINNAGVVYERAKVPVKLFYNFLMALRFPWEIPQAFNTYLLLIGSGMEERLACFVSNNFVLRQGAASLDGPWDVAYPWSFLEGCGLDAASRFLSSSPAEIRGAATPNVFPLWKDDTMTSKSDATLDSLADDKALSLSQIVTAVETFR